MGKMTIEELEREVERLKGDLTIAERRGLERAESIARKAANEIAGEHEGDFDRMAGMLKVAELIRSAGKAGA